MAKKKVILILLIGLLFASLVSANLNEEQLNEAASKIQQKCPEYSFESIRTFVSENDCPSNVISTGSSFEITCLSGKHTYGCSQSIHYFDGEVISILSSKTDITNIQTTGDDSPVTTGDDSPINQTTFNFEIGFYLSLTANVVLGFSLWEKLKKKSVLKKKKKEKKNG